MQFGHLGRREFITPVGGAAAWPLAARAQQGGKIARIGFLGANSASSWASRLEAFRLGLRAHGLLTFRVRSSPSAAAKA
jgi:putative ABC transport system substrate-binding protein